MDYTSRLQFYKEYIQNITPSNFEVEIQNNSIVVDLPQIKENIYNRNQMPQLKRKFISNAISQMHRGGIGISYGKILPKKCVPLQKQIYKSKMQDIIDTLLNQGTSDVKPIIISNDNYIIDGHHRWGAFLTKFPNHPVNFVRIKKPKHTALNIYNKISKNY